MNLACEEVEVVREVEERSKTVQVVEDARTPSDGSPVFQCREDRCRSNGSVAERRCDRCLQGGKRDRRGPWRQARGAAGRTAGY
ncbi:MAG: hypothetical protein KatS3mg111_1216 [Pirellulaceae bacterium]|nr:MAG: hypothetical protein KatS3mg111_1216 [Pirellulaceae bacterium]